MPQRFPYPPGTTCSRCPRVLEPGRRHRYCQPCSNAYARGRRLQPGQRDKAVALFRQKTYGLSAEEYARLLAAQAGVCAICLRPETAKRRGITKTLAVDHDHASGRVRGLLCVRCNVMLGWFEARPWLLDSALAYMDKASEREAAA